MESLENGLCLVMFIQLYPQKHDMSHYGNLLFSMSKFMNKIVWVVTIIQIVRAVKQHNMSHYGNLLFSMSKFMDKIVWAVTIILLQKVQ